MPAPLVLLEAAAIAAETGDVMRLGGTGATAKPDGRLLLREPETARMGVRGRRWFSRDVLEAFAETMHRGSMGKLAA